ncbi:protein of unknown function (plasmid) [Cupriavidus taiwanensis]|uniref:Uncharacterized protein n=1 Tax=Cupriavidus taiwanensis TaxID=164546 RepID=A0A375IV43_9BURK|nr:protein of unknown function [Cupriavidus taiwanensis]
MPDATEIKPFEKQSKEFMFDCLTQTWPERSNLFAGSCRFPRRWLVFEPKCVTIRRFNERPRMHEDLSTSAKF